ncbi:protoporphyrinogen/coproporphyrinogen oxidase [Nocardia iowensis]|uniref:FAD-dependent oxidoreductase n=1 Tax=Nocardia iowensis TaxID=204891 RepID=A0ABX8RFI8_NOCIO|nr:FAD-dependent oxidoreductase [Nocardia iowensis]QXN88360.1 FAD-dependent oxidoreductase [Nocardia iowensis]
MEHRSGCADRRFAVIGGGVSGMAAAYQLRRAGAQVELIERDTVLGGRLGLDRLGDRPVTMGAQLIGEKYFGFREFLADLGVDSYERYSIALARTVGDKLIMVDPTRYHAVMRYLSSVGSAREVAKFAYLVGKVRGDGRFLGSRYFATLGARSDHKPLSEHFGPGLSTVVRPMIRWMNGAEPDEVYLGTFGTNLGWFVERFYRMPGGVQLAVDEFARRVTVRTDARVEGIVVRGGQVSGLAISENGWPTREYDYDGVILATSAHDAADLVKPEFPELSELLAQVRYFPGAVAMVEYDRELFGPGAYGFSVEDDSPCSLAVAEGRTDRHIGRYMFHGRRARPAPSDAEFERWLDEAEQRALDHYGGGPVHRVHTLRRSWQAGYCAYLPYYGDFLSALDTALSECPGLTLAGDYLRGGALEGCYRAGVEAARRACALSTGQPTDQLGKGSL